MRLSTLLTSVLLACGAPPEATDTQPDPVDPVEPSVEPEASDSWVLLSPTDRLLRVAMATKGTRPTSAEIDAVLADPDALDGIVDAYLASEQFGETVMDVENQTLLVRVDNLTNPPAGAGVTNFQWGKALFEEPLALVEWVVTSDRPYTDIVTLQGTMTTRHGASMWAGIPDTFDPDGPEWQFAAFTDGRPAAGVLSTGGWNHRVASNLPNAHREGAAAAAAALLCTDYLSRDINLGEVDLTDEDAIADAILHEPACVSCHQTLDPLAGFLSGFALRGVASRGYPIEEWNPMQAGRGFRQTGRENGYFGLGGETLTDVGALIADDNRFSACTARRYLAYLHQVPLEEVPFEQVAAAQSALVDSDMSLKAMFKHIVLSDAFAASHATDASAETLRGYLQTRPEQLDRVFRDLVGFTWKTPYGIRALGFDVTLPTSSRVGFKVHGGGIDSQVKVVPVHSYSATASAFLRSFAEEAAGHAVEADAGRTTAERVLFVETLDVTDEAAVRAQLAHLHARVWGERDAPDSVAVDATYALLTDIHAMTGDAQTTWQVVLTALFQDFRVAYH
jgi:hypothetical protein